MTTPTHDRVFVMTGATSGLGAHAAARMAAQPSTRLIIGARDRQAPAPTGAEVVPLDLASLESVRAFADVVLERTGSRGIDVLILNAGAQFPKADRQSVDGFELTFAVNHLAHYLLVRLLLPAIAEGGRIILTTSDTHDPEIFRGAPRELDPQGWAHPAPGDSSAARAYAASKLCDLLTARSLAALDDVVARSITVIAFNPGLTWGTSLGRAQPRAARTLMRGAKPIFYVLSLFRSQYYPHTAERSGEALSQLALGIATPPPGHVYASLVKGKLTYPAPSTLARSDEARDRLWSESATMVQLG